MPTALASRLTEIWQEFTTAKDSRARDACGQEVWLTLTRQARGTPPQRCALVAKNLVSDVESDSLRAILPEAAKAVYAWYESDFSKAARLFKQLETKLKPKSRSRNAFCADCCRIMRVHGLCWAAAASVRMGKPKNGHQHLKKAACLLGGNRPKLLNAEGWYWAEFGRLAFGDRDLRAAEDGYSRAYACFDDAQNEYALAEIDGARARLLTHQGRYSLALQRIASAQRWRDHDNPLERAKLCFHTGRIFRYQHNYKEALGQFQAGLRYVREVKNAHWQANLHDALGDVYLLLGKPDEAGRQYQLYSASRGKEPAAQRRRKYQQAKLTFHQAIAEQPGPAQQQMLRQVHRACMDLSRGSNIELLPSKAQMLAGQALLKMHDYTAAVTVSEQAVRGFREADAWWHAAEAMLLTGEAHLAAANVAAAAQVFLAGLNSTVDDLQRQRFLGKIHQRASTLDPREVCACIADLLNENHNLAKARDAYQHIGDGLRSLLVSISRPLRVGIGSVAHLRRQVEDLVEKFPGDKSIANARDEVRAHAELLNCQWQLTEHWQTRLSTPQWLSFAQIVDGLNLRIPATQVTWLRRRCDLGIFADPQLITKALEDLVEVMRQWVGALRASCASADSDGHLALRFCGTPRGWEPAGSKLAELAFGKAPSLNALRACHLEPHDWAKLNWAAIRLKSIGGQVRLRAEKRSANRPHRQCCLEVEIPCDQVPLWHTDLNSNTFKER